METILPTQPATYKTIITASLKLYRASFKYIFLLSLFLSVITFIPRILSDAIGQDIFYRLTPLAPERLWLVVIDFGVLILFIALLWRIHCVILKKHEPYIEDLTMGVKKFFSAWVATLISSAFILCALLIVYALLKLMGTHLSPNTDWLHLFIVNIAFAVQLLLLLYVMTLFFFVVPLIATENNGIIGAIEQSISLIWNHWWRTFSVQMTPWMSYLIAILLIKYILHINIHLYFMGNHPHSFLSTVVNLILFAFYIPWTAALLLTQLHDLKLRKKASHRQNT